MLFLRPRDRDVIKNHICTFSLVKKEKNGVLTDLKLLKPCVSFNKRAYKKENILPAAGKISIV